MRKQSVMRNHATEFDLENEDLELDSDARAIRRAFRESHLELIRYARGRVGSFEEAQDIVQEAFANALTAVETGARIRSMEGFLRRSVCNMCMNHTRDEPAESIDEELHLLGEQTIEASVELRERWREVIQAVDELAPNQRLAFVLSELNGFDSQEIARRMNCSTEAVWQLLSRSRANIRERVKTRSSS